MALAPQWYARLVLKLDFALVVIFGRALRMITGGTPTSGVDCAAVMPKGLMPWYAAFGARPLDVMAGYHHLMQLLEQVWKKKKKDKDKKGERASSAGDTTVSKNESIVKSEK